MVEGAAVSLTAQRYRLPGVRQIAMRMRETRSLHNASRRAWRGARIISIRQSQYATAGCHLSHAAVRAECEVVARGALPGGVEFRAMGDNDATVRIRARWEGDTAITREQAAKLRELYSDLQDATTAASEALGTTGAAPSGMALQRFRELDARVLELVERIRETLD